MKNGEFKIIVAISSLIVVFAIFFGGYWLYNRYGVDKPLIDKISDISGVKTVEIDKQDQIIMIDIKLNNIDDLQSEYNDIKEIIDTQFEGENYRIKINDNRNQKLKNAYQDIQLSVYQAVANNQFLWLKEQMQNSPELKGLSYKLFVDENNLYIQIKDGNHALYEVINRQQNKLGLQ